MECNLSSLVYSYKIVYRDNMYIIAKKKSHRDLMCVGRYAAKVMRNERSEMEHNRSEMPANIA